MPRKQKTKDFFINSGSSYYTEPFISLLCGVALALLWDMKAAYIAEFEGDFECAVNAAEKACEWLPPMQCQEDVERECNLYNNLAAIKLRAGDVPGAMEGMMHVLEVREKYQQVALYDRVPQDCNFAMICIKAGRPSVGLKVLENCKKVVREQRGDGDLYYAELLIMEAVVNASVSKYKEAEKCLNEVKEIYKDVYDEEENIFQNKMTEAVSLVLENGSYKALDQERMLQQYIQR